MNFSHLFQTLAIVITFVSIITALPAEPTPRTPNSSVLDGPNTLLGRPYYVRAQYTAAKVVEEEDDDLTLWRHSMAFRIKRDNLLSHQVQEPAPSSSTHPSSEAVYTPIPTTTVQPHSTKPSNAKGRKKMRKTKPQMNFKNKDVRKTRRD